MILVRLLRVAAIAAVIAVLFNVSQQVTLRREGTTTPGIGWALGVLSSLFLVRAIVTERTAPAEDNLQKDFLWGVASGGFVGLAVHLLVL